MKKSVLITIFIIYVASIIVIGFFGIKLRVYDEVKYIKEITITAEAENEEAFSIKEIGKDETTGNNKYELKIDYTKSATDESTGEKYLVISLIPHVVYDSGDLAAGKGESIKYTTLNQNYIDKGFFSIDQFGIITIKRQSFFAFTVMVNPETQGGFGTGAIIKVIVLNHI